MSHIRDVEDRRSEKNAACAHDAAKRFERTVYGTAFGRLPLARLVSLDIKAWRRETGLSKSSQNRTMTAQRTVPLARAAVALFDRLAQGKLPGDLLFTRDDGKRWAHSDWDELVRAAAARAGLCADVRPPYFVETNAEVPDILSASTEWRD